MSEINQSNVAIKIKIDQSLVFPQDEDLNQKGQEQIDVNQVPIITQNVPFTNPIKPISKWYIFFNINLNCSIIMVIILPILSLLSQMVLYLLISYTIISYIVYLAISYKFSNLIFLIDLRSIHEYRAIFQKLVAADCELKFTYAPARNRIDEKMKKYQKRYQKVKIIDKSGKLYNIQRYYSIALIKYNKKYYYANSETKTKVTNQFHNFIEKCRNELENKKKKLLNSRQKIELSIKDLETQIGYYIQEDNHYKFIFLFTLFFSLGVYYQYFMRKKILRYEMDIVKEIWLE